MYLLKIILITTIINIGINAQEKPPLTSIKKEVIASLKQSETDWNEGNIEKYMQVYVKSDSLRFVGNNSYRQGWEKVFEGYKNGYKDKSVMGNLIFSELSVTVLNENAALVFGRFTLNRKDDNPTGLFTLIFIKTDDGWKIIHDHTSVPCGNK